MRTSYFLLIVLALLTACSSRKMKTGPIIEPPAGFTFEKRINFNSAINTIYMPLSGGEFNAKKADTPEANSLYYFGKSSISIYPTLDDFEGTIDLQIEEAKKPTKYGPRIGKTKETSVISVTKKTISGREVACIDNSCEYGQGYGALNFGYLIMNGKKAMLIMVKDIYITPETNIEDYRNSLNSALTYMVKTLEFK